ncbi:zinc-binding alcohol dehydrogenase family protein [Collimonas sp. OK607]|uniref:zinc-binding alcohol dehydrogenase family protein n=1 Tax=Collimonas sp. OK607 TaxID=1798194 RepID=UPI0008EEFED0|nr:zinc-binding alcohol dehydrogenase family protein [Collimonas sp. OK607]SFB32951.1 zinc-binding alcohol dehydrogenase family protein [Collimonas sp. OK607]
MKAIALTRYLPIENPESLFDIQLDKPSPQGRDLLVEIKAIAVNPVDVKVRAPKDTVEKTPRVLGWDAAGIVQAVGADVSRFKVGDRVFYAGDITRPGANSEFQLVDERIVGNMPQSLSFEQAAALPLTTITAWEALFDRLHISPASAAATISAKSILIIGGAGGVGSIAIQLAVKVAGLKVIATASRPESEKWVRDLGAQHVINHYGDLAAQLKQQGFEHVDYVLILNDTDRHFPAAAAVIAPQGTICTIVENDAPLDVSLLKSKSAGFIWEFMFTRSMFQTADMQQQGNLLDQVARLIDNKIVVTTVNQVLSPINAANLRQAHATLETGRAIGKIVLKDF